MYAPSFFINGIRPFYPWFCGPLFKHLFSSASLHLLGFFTSLPKTFFSVPLCFCVLDLPPQRSSLRLRGLHPYQKRFSLCLCVSVFRIFLQNALLCVSVVYILTKKVLLCVSASPWFFYILTKNVFLCASVSPCFVSSYRTLFSASPWFTSLPKRFFSASPCLCGSLLFSSPVFL